MEEWNRLISKYLAGEATAEERLLLEQWLKQDIRNMRYFQRSKDIWEVSGEPVHDTIPDVSKALQDIQRKIDKREDGIEISPGRTMFYYIRRIAAVLIVGVTVGMGYFVFRGTKTTPLTHLVTAVSERRVVLMTDGTRVWLNGNSEITYPEKFSDTIREVTLRGEAYFDVAKDHTKPFVISTGNTITRIVGTSFNVRALQEEENTIVTVTSGKVAFGNAGDKTGRVMLTKGEQGIANKQSGIVIKQSNTDRNFLSWHDGKIVFGNTPFREVCRTLSDFYHVTMVPDNTILTCRLTSVYQNQSLSAVLEEFHEVYGLTIIREGNVVRLSGKRCD